MTKRWLSVSLLVVMWLGAPRLAHATLTATPNPTDVGSVVVESVGMVAASIATDTVVGGDHLDHFDLSAAGCAAFSIAPATPNTQITIAAPLPIMVKFSPTVAGTQQCTVTMMSTPLGAPVGTFVIKGEAVAPGLTITSPNGPPVSFGSHRVNGSTSTLNFTFKNASSDVGQNLIVQAPTFGASTEYTLVTAGFPITLAPNATKVVQVKFDPSAAGTRTATMSVMSNDPIHPVETVALTGVGTTAVINVTATVPFGVVTDGTTSTLPISVSTTGTGPLTVQSASISPSGTFISFATNAPDSCAGASSCTFSPARTVNSGTPIAISVQCAPPPGATGTQSATVTFTSDSDAGGANTTLVTCTAGQPMIVENPSNLAFGSIPVGTPSASLPITIMNAGNSTLHYSIAKAPSPSNEYATTGCVSACTLAAGGMATVGVVFTPVVVGLDSVTMTITSDDPVQPTVAIALTGTGSGGIATITAPTSPPLAFGSNDVGTTSTGQAITVTNTGNATLTIASASFATASFTILSGAPAPIAAGSSLTWSVACSPTTFGPLTDTFTILSNGIASGSETVAVTCTGNQGILSVIPASFDFGNVRDGDLATTTVTLKNTGNATVSNIADAFSSTTAGYTFTTSVPTSLTAGGSATIGVQFAPTLTATGGTVTVSFTGTWGTAGTTATTLTLNGNALVPGFDVAPNALAFGNIRFDQSATLQFSVINSDTAPFKVTSITIAPDAATMTTNSEFTVIAITHGGVAATLPVNLATLNDSIVVTVQAAPAARTGVMHATATVTSDLAPPNATRTVDLSATATAAMLAIAPNNGAFDFGSVDVDGPAANQTLTITNTGTGNLDLPSIVPMIGGSAAFTVTLPPGSTTLAPGDQLAVPVIYKPTVEGLDQLTIVASLAGLLGGPNMASLTLTGHGIDRFISVPATVTFPSAFRNPGTAAPTMAVTVSNTGMATLHISATMIDNPDIYQLTDTGTVDIPGLGSHDFLVTFAPNMAGAAPLGHMTINNDDNTSPQTMMAVIVLNGLGLARNVQLGPTNIELGYTGIGVPITLPDGLSIISMDPTNTFTIAAVSLSGDQQPFTVDQSPVDVALAPSTTATFGITFDPTAEGDYSTTASLFLDQDPTPQAMVTISGHAVFVDAHGGGGCAAGHDAGGLVVVFGVLVLVVLRRRRRATIVAVAVIALGTVVRHARADNLDLTLFNPTPQASGESFQLLSADVGASGDWAATTVVSYATNPLVLGAFDQGTHVNDDRAITQRTLFDVGGSYAFLDRFEAGARMPLYSQSGDAKDPSMTEFGVPPASGTARGDLTLHGKARLWRGDALGGFLVLGSGVEVTLPTATAGQFTGGDGPSVRALGLIGFTPNAFNRRLAISLNAGAVLRRRAEFANLEQGSGFAWGAGASARLLDRLWMTGEIFGDLIPSGTTAEMGGKTMLSPIEALGGFNYRIERRVTVGVAVGRGVTTGIGSPDIRGVFALTFVAGVPELAPIHPMIERVDGDADGDGIPDSVDKCPNEPEDFDGFQDADGCPDPDNDHDGIPDISDKCPNQPEDKDGFQDADGCPDPDNDGDGIPDVKDKCPNEPEDFDGFQDADGCPDPDNDHDGILDVNDKCPNEPETINGFQDEDGCPDKGDGLVSVSPDRLELLESVQWNGAKLAKASFNLLGQVGATLRAHTEILRVRITTHVQPTNNPERDQELTDKRAEAVRDWLVHWGLPIGRLEVHGFGGTKPLVPATQKGAAVINNRLELIILERK